MENGRAQHTIQGGFPHRDAAVNFYESSGSWENLADEHFPPEAIARPGHDAPLAQRSAARVVDAKARKQVLKIRYVVKRGGDYDQDTFLITSTVPKTSSSRSWGPQGPASRHSLVISVQRQPLVMVWSLVRAHPVLRLSEKAMLTSRDRHDSGGTVLLSSSRRHCYLVYRHAWLRRHLQDGCRRAL